jgi:FlaA1/EpsC-like NDP-sugar epimerase
VENTNFFNNKRILVTGCCGTVGAELCKQLLGNKYKIAELIGIDNNESELLYSEQRFSMRNARFILGDVRDRDQLSNVMDGIDIVFHCAGLKHVILCERSPVEAIQTNIWGVQNIIFAAIKNGVNKVIFTSSDKAVNPTNVMGTSKLMGERLMTAANSNFRGQGTIFASTRFGNVLGSRGSVIPIFHQQIRKGGPVTLTDPRMTRFIMSIEQSVNLVITSAEIARGGEVFVTKMPVIKIVDLANIMIKELSPRYGYNPENIRITEIGMKPGEKIYEELMSQEEIRRSIELHKYFVILPAFRGIYRDIEYDYPDIVKRKIDHPYISQEGPFMTVKELENFLNETRLLQPDSDDYHPDERYWPGDI